MLKEEQIYHLIRSNSCSFWKLFLKNDRFAKGQSIANYNGDNLPEDCKGEDSIEAGIEALKNQLSIYQDVPNIFFEIKLHKSKTASGDSILGPFAFTLNNSNLEMPLGNIAHAGSGIGMGMVPKTQMEAMLEIVGLKSNLQLERALFEREKKEFKEEKRLAEDELREREKEYTNLYNAAKNASKKGIMEAGFKLGKALGWFDDDANLGDIDQNKPESGGDNSPEEKAALSVAELLVEKNLSVSDIHNIKELVTKLIEKKNGTNI